MAHRLSRRSLLRAIPLAGLGAAGFGGAACTAGSTSATSTGLSGGGDARPVRIGYVTPTTGGLAAFGQADSFVLETIRDHFADAGLRTQAGTSEVRIEQLDAASDPQQATAAALDLIDNSQVDLILVSSTPDITNPVADVCERRGVPCISTIAPWQSWFFGRGATQVSRFRWTYHFFGGLEDVATVFMDMWDEVLTNRRIGALWPDDPDGNAWGDPAIGLPALVAERGYEIVDPGFYSNGSTNFGAQIQLFLDEQVEILVGVPIPADFPAFWQQASARGFSPRIATVGKALLFPSAIEPLGPRGDGLATEVWWSPRHPFRSSLTGQTAQQLADAYTDATGEPWTQPLGLVHSLFEVAAAALAGADGPDDRAGVVDTLSRLSVPTVCGTLDWTAGPVPNVARTPLVGGQWRVTQGAPELVVVSNAQALGVPRSGTTRPLSA